jgi:branched-chain amino acid transport system permease protein
MKLAPPSRVTARFAVIGASLLVAMLLPLVLTDAYFRGVLNLAVIYALLALGFNFTFGYAGQISLGHVGFWAIGAYTSALLTTDYGLSVLVSALIGVCLCAGLATLLGLVTTRLRTHYLALATLGFGEIVHVILLNWRSVTKGNAGVGGIPPLQLGPFEATSVVSEYYVLLAFLVVGALVAWRFQTSHLGRAGRSLKQSPLAAQVIGIHTTRLKTLALVVSSVYASVAGSLYAHMFGFLSPDTFTITEMIRIVAMVVVGGQGLVAGAVFGGTLLTFLPEVARGVERYWLLFYGIALVLLVTRMPYGVVGLAIRVWDRLGSRSRPPDDGPQTSVRIAEQARI